MLFSNADVTDVPSCSAVNDDKVPFNLPIAVRFASIITILSNGQQLPFKSFQLIVYRLKERNGEVLSRC